MRVRAAPAVLAGALIAGIVTGFMLLPQLFGNGVAVAPATRPGWPSHSTGIADRPFGTAMLLQTDDFLRLGLEFDRAHQHLDGGQRLTGCTGSLTMADLTAGAAPAGSSVSASWHNAAAAEQARLSESVSRGPSVRAASRRVSALIERLSGCSYSEQGHDRHLGRARSVPTDVGSAVRFITYNADGTPAGGIVVFRSGRDFGVCNLFAPDAHSPGEALNSLGVAALRRID